MFRINAARVRGLLFSRQLTVEEFARKARLNAATARKALSDGAKLSGAVVGRLAEFFNVDGEELILKE